MFFIVYFNSSNLVSISQTTKKYLKITQKFRGLVEKQVGHLKKVKNTLIQNQLQSMVFFMIQFLQPVNH